MKARSRDNRYVSIPQSRTKRARRRQGKHTFSLAPGEYLRHAVELTHDALLALGDADRVVEDGIFSVMRVHLMRRIEAVELEDIVYELLFLLRGLLGWCVLAFFRGSHDCAMEGLRTD